MRRHKPLILTLLALGVALALLVAFVGLHRTVLSREPDPSGRYIVETSARTFYRFIPRGPGQGSDLPVFVEIFTREGRSLGRIPVPMLQSVSMDWRADGVEIHLIGEWDFKKQTCYYWDESGNRKIYVEGGE